MSELDDLRQQVERQARRMKKAEEERPSLMGQTIYIGTLGLLFIIPIVGGAYLGLWLDSMQEDYSTVWTMSFFLLGIIIGALNVYLFIRE